LTINDSAEGSNVSTGVSADFFAFYVNLTDSSPIADASCNVTFDEAPTGPFEMTWNGTGNDGYNYTRVGGFAAAAIHDWNVTCFKIGFDLVTANDTINVTAPVIPPPAGGPSSVPEFSDYAIILLIIVVVGGFFFMRRRTD